MPDHERAMLAYAKLAEISAQKEQIVGRDKLLVLAGASACRAGWPDVAQRCRELILANNAVHLIGKHATFADALRSPDFEPFLKQRERLCSYERAEHLLRGVNLDPSLPESEHDTSAGEFALKLLSYEAD